MQLSQRVAERLTRTIEATDLASDPFAHLAFSSVFPPDVYAELLAQMPADAYYRELKHSDAMLPDGRSARLQFPLVPGNIARLPAAQAAFWREVVAGLRGREDFVASGPLARRTQPQGRDISSR